MIGLDWNRWEPQIGAWTCGRESLALDPEYLKVGWSGYEKAREDSSPS